MTLKNKDKNYFNINNGRGYINNGRGYSHNGRGYSYLVIIVKALTVVSRVISFLRRLTYTGKHSSNLSASISPRLAIT